MTKKNIRGWILSLSFLAGVGLLCLICIFKAQMAFAFTAAALPCIAALAIWATEARKIPARAIAVLSALTALACALRLVRIPVEGLEFTNFLVILAGIALGPSEGFLAGALTPLVSNFYLGQGTWTAWQMLAWGLLGLAAGLLKDKKAKRWELFVGGLCSGWAYGFLLNLYYFIYLRQFDWKMLWIVLAQGFFGDTLSGVCTAVLLVISWPWALKLCKRAAGGE
ncbi:MAG: ECF transporter S component [Aeriscardovia sp.]|nr:ECF transporter S component [Aeriscardovia sp.]MBO6071910.1 ECF transporter S component [Aeriscardovia sp.]MBO7717463.1 ECF transporter S component [Aeriscardovia sp.]